MSELENGIFSMSAFSLNYCFAVLVVLCLYITDMGLFVGNIKCTAFIDVRILISCMS